MSAEQGSRLERFARRPVHRMTGTSHWPFDEAEDVGKERGLQPRERSQTSDNIAR
jgi:hypothetical protein